MTLALVPDAVPTEGPTIMIHTHQSEAVRRGHRNRFVWDRAVRWTRDERKLGKNRVHDDAFSERPRLARWARHRMSRIHDRFGRNSH